MLKLVVSTLRALPGVNQLLSKVINKEISGFITELYGNDSIKRSCDAVIPETGECLSGIHSHLMMKVVYVMQWSCVSCMIT